MTRHRHGPRRGGPLWWAWWQTWCLGGALLALVLVLLHPS
ncbi:hypothetical protein ACVWXU_000375 [Streptomyces sp. TE33382]